MDVARQCLKLIDLAELGLAQGIRQVGMAGPPLQPFFLDESGRMYLLGGASVRCDPIQIALPALKSRTPSIQRCALVLGTRITVANARADAIVAIVCERSAERAEVWVQRYLPRRAFRELTVAGAPEKVADTRNFIRAALEET